MIRVGIIGAGKIGSPVAQAINGALADRFVLSGVLTRSGDADAFFDAAPDIVIEAAGIEAVGTYGARALQGGDFWVTSGAALGDATLIHDLKAVATRAETHMRVLSGAIAGLDSVRTASADPNMTLALTICLAPHDGPRETVFTGTVASAAKHFPSDINVAVAAALAGHGPVRTLIDVVRPALGEPRELRMLVRSAFGDFDTVSRPKVVPPQGIHTVAANIIAALGAYQQPMRVY